jgi:hypothetical protein
MNVIVASSIISIMQETLHKEKTFAWTTILTLAQI